MDQLIPRVARERMTAKELAEQGPETLSRTRPITGTTRINDYPKEVYGRDQSETIYGERPCSIMRSLTGLGYPLFISEGLGNKCRYITEYLSSWAPVRCSNC